MAFKFSFFRVAEHKKFEYSPRIWDPDKEDREERLKRIQEEMGIIDHTSDNTPYVPNIKGRFRKEYEQNIKTSKAKGGYGKRVRNLIFIGAVLLLCIIFFYIAQLYPHLFPSSEANEDTLNAIELYE